jgi:multidrug efflux pump subunit AcrA (membrane-fusion protein)
MSKFIQSLQNKTIIFVAAFALSTAGIGSVSIANAEDGGNTQNDSTSESQKTPPTDDAQRRLRAQQREDLELKKQEMQTAKEAAEARLKARHEARQDKLSASQLEICKGREANINNRIARIADRSTKHLELFSKISERAQAFYVSKGISLANYDELVADVQAKKTAAETAVTSINNTTTDFDCTGENPKLTIEEFKSSLKTSIDILKEYRTSVKNLIVGIKSATATTPRDESQPTNEVEQ